MKDVHVAIIGAGVAGLSAAHRLTEAGIPYLLLEARDRLGGRVLTLDHDGHSGPDGFDLGPSWIWPAMQPAVQRAIADLGLETFTQFSDGDVVFERMSREPSRRYTATEDIPAAQQSTRIKGGSSALVQALAEPLSDDSLVLQAQVTHLELISDGVQVSYLNSSKVQSSVHVNYVIAAVPPRMLASNIVYSPAPEPETVELWRSTPTWMASQAKFIAVYEQPFWREDGLSGSIQSLAGPMSEIHDATTAHGEAALMGFIGITPADRRHVGGQALTAACLEQLTRVFGQKAATPKNILLKDWAADELTSTAEDLISVSHPVPAKAWTHGAWTERLILGGSEVSDHEAGYLAGAIEAGAKAAQVIAEYISKDGVNK